GERTMIYLLHYDRPLHHAQHYLGSCDDPQRIQDHGNGTSRARLPQVFCQLGVQFVVARTWEGSRTGERKLKNQKNARVLCPICRTAKLSVRAKQKRERRRQRKLPFPKPPFIPVLASLLTARYNFGHDSSYRRYCPRPERRKKPH
ncbi:MAG TPA: hypothetical protein VI685_18910, partial [Candidatus Angelobacter sp.]